MGVVPRVADNNLPQRLRVDRENPKGGINDLVILSVLCVSVVQI